MPSLPPLGEYVEILKGVWESGILTHNGPLVQQLEADLCRRLELRHFVAVTNGTLALQMAIKALRLKGEIITSPFTWIATVSAIQWQGCDPVFCDIDAETLNLDPYRLEALISEQTVAIMPVHVFGNPCDVEAIEAVARRHKLKVIYDGAHALGSTLGGRSLLEYGDITATSLHATKLLNTAEGGGLVTRDPEMHARLKRIRFFGHDEGKDIIDEGLNGKMTEIHAALGIVNLRYFEAVCADRKRKYAIYEEAFKATPGIRLQKLKFGQSNFSYFPIIFDSEARLLAAEKILADADIFPRRYFYPSVNTFTRILRYQPAPVSEDVSRRILCLPLFFALPDETVYEIINLLTH